MVYGYHKSDELYHHGIFGMKWGERNGPPYPLGADDHSASEKKAGWRKSLKNGKENQNDSKKGLLFPRTVKSMVRSTFHPASVELAMIADDAIDIGIAKAKDKMDDKRREKLPVDKKTGLHLKTKEMNISQDAKKVNPGFHSAFGGKQNENCTYCSVAYSLRRKGYDVKANDCEPQYFNEVLKKAYQPPPKETIPLKDVAFRSSQKIPRKEREQRMDDICKAMIGNGKDKFGSLSIMWKTGWIGHALSYEVKDGKLMIIDPQIGKVYNNPKSFLKHCSLDSSLWFAETTNSKINAKTIKEVVR